jgi:hypothetical protein
MSQANVLTSASNVIWYTDKCEIVTGANSVTYQIYVMPAGPAATSVITGQATNGSNVLVTTQASSKLVGANISGTGVAGTTTVVSVSPKNDFLILSSNATASSPTSTTNYAVTLHAPGNLYSTATQVAANSRQQIYVGAGNYLTITGGNVTARELGTASSATAGF